MKSKLIFPLALLLITVVSCELSDDEPTGPYAGVDEELVPFFISFEQEAAKRGIPIDLTKERVSAGFEQILTFGVLGRCERRSNGTRHIIMESDDWDERSYLDKEQLVFHELGHCALLRIHKEDVNQNNQCLSIMRSGRSGCFFPYNEGTREIYLTELFDLDNN